MIDECFFFSQFFDKDILKNIFRVNGSIQIFIEIVYVAKYSNRHELVEFGL